MSREQGLRLHKAGLAQKPYQVLTEPQFALPLKWGPPLMADVCLYPKKGWEGIEGVWVFSHAASHHLCFQSSSRIEARMKEKKDGILQATTRGKSASLPC